MKKVRSLILKLLLGIAMLFVAGCTAGCESTVLEDERANLVATQKVFAATVRGLVKARDAGKIDEDLEAEIDPIIKTVNENLKVWEEALLEGNSRPDLKKIIDVNVQLLKDILAKVETD